MYLEPQTSRVDQIARIISDEIERGRFLPGEKLPTAQELTARLGVSRSVVREALATLRADGLVVSRQGAGVFVAHNPPGKPFQIDASQLESVPKVLQVMQLRLAVEVEAAGCAAEARTTPALAAISKALDEIDVVISKGESAASADAAFHLAIADATGNPYFSQFVQFLGSLLIPRGTVKLSFSSLEEQQSYLWSVQQEHRALFAAIQGGKAEAARQLMHAHLQGSMDRYKAWFAK